MLDSDSESTASALSTSAVPAVADKLAEGTDAVAEASVAATAEGGGDATAEGETDAAAGALAELVPGVATAGGEANAVAELVPDGASETEDNAVATAQRAADVASLRMADCGVEGDTRAAAARTGEESCFG